MVSLYLVYMARERITRKWEIFQGRNKFYCNGRIMTAPNSGVFLFTLFIITLTSMLFFIFDCKYLAENVTIAIPIIGAMLFLFTMSSLLRTSLSDPGIIPRASSEEAAYVEKQIEVTNSANSPTYRPPPRTKEVLVKGQTIKLKYCFTCKIFRPPRASHCSLCDNCVDRFDHHCPWVGNCVGRRNYRFFYMFIISLAFLAVFIFACAVAHLILMTKDDREFLDAVKESPPSVIVAVICFFSVWSILGLAGFHTYLTTSNQTTNEDIKGSFTSKRGQDNFNPYSEGNICLNCFHILCGPVTPSLIDRRGIVTESYRNEQSRSITSAPTLPFKKFTAPIQNGPQLVSPEMSGIYRQTSENVENNTGSVAHLVPSEQPLAVIPTAVHRKTYREEENFNKVVPNKSHLYNNVLPHIRQVEQKGPDKSVEKSPSFPKETVNGMKDIAVSVEDLHLDPIILREGHLLATYNGKSRYGDLKLDNDLTRQEKENNLFSVSRLRLLQDTTMIESALDLDSLDGSSLGTNSQAGLMKIEV
ncbi:unnamed protein product [Phyllotreta striolata]|uniref:Palmitoyltransferase n=1 Tax=Phyllotreta striolata TaxID=444603 RepID=A0A9N9XNU5_PHYSR|nr:unnamed protein product [Phyllotreta striolata]